MISMGKRKHWSPIMINTYLKIYQCESEWMNEMCLLDLHGHDEKFLKILQITTSWESYVEESYLLATYRFGNQTDSQAFSRWLCNKCKFSWSVDPEAMWYQSHLKAQCDLWKHFLFALWSIIICCWEMILLTCGHVSVSMEKLKTEFKEC